MDKAKFQKILDKTVVKGKKRSEDFFRQYNSRGTGFPTNVFNRLRTEFSKKARECKNAESLDDLGKLCDLLENFLETQLSLLRNEEVEAELRKIINEGRTEFLRALAKAEKQTSGGDGSSGSENLDDNDESLGDDETNVEITTEIYETIIKNEIRRWFEAIIDLSFNSIAPLYLISKEKFDEIILETTRVLENLIDVEIPLQIMASFPFDDSDINEEAELGCSQEILNLVDRAMKPIWQLLENNENKQVEVAQLSNEQLFAQIDYHTILAVREAKKIETQAWEIMALEVDDNRKEELKEKIQRALLGTDRYEYALGEKEITFQARPEHFLYPIELEMIERKVFSEIDKLIEKGSGNVAQTDVKNHFRSEDEGDTALIEIASMLNTQVHCGFDIRDGLRDKEALLAFIMDLVDNYYQSGRAGFVAVKCQKRSDLIPAEGLAGGIEDAPSFDGGVENALPPAEEIAMEVSPSSDDGCGMLQVTETADVTSSGATPEGGLPATVETGVILGLSPLSLRTLAIPIVIKYLPEEDLSPEDRPEHVPVEIFEKINVVLRWARDAQGKTRSIHRIIVAFTALITTHLRTLNLPKILTLLSQLEVFKEHLGKDFSISKNKPVEHKDLVASIIASLAYLDNENDPVAIITRTILADLQTLKEKMISGERNLEITEKLEAEKEELRGQIEVLEERISQLESQEAEIQTNLTNEQQIMSKVAPASAEFMEILTKLTSLHEKLVKVIAEKTSLNSQKEKFQQQMKVFELPTESPQEIRARLEKMARKQDMVRAKLDEALALLNQN